MCIRQDKELPFPGNKKTGHVPKREPLVYGCFKIYTDMKKQSWRIMRQGELKDKQIPWKADSKDAWKTVQAFVQR